MATEPQTAFFSYSRDDSEFAIRLATDLKAAGANVWLDQLDIAPGQRWARAVQDALNNCQRLLVILSPSSVSSTNVEDEVAFALEEHKAVIPVFYRDCKVPFQLRPFQYVDFRTDYARGAKTLLRALGVSHLVEEQSQATEKARLEREESERQAEKARLEQEERDLQAAAEKARLEQEEQERQAAAEKARLEQEEGERLLALAAAEKARKEQEERKRRAAEKARLEQEEQERQAAAEKARLEQEESERLLALAAAEKARKEQEERKRRAAEKARLEQEEQERQAAAEKARLEQEESERLLALAAAEKARKEQEERERRAAEKARLEQEEQERQAAAEKARREKEERERLAAQKAQLEQQERERTEGKGSIAATSARSALVSPAFMKVAAVVGGITLLILVVYWATRPKTPKVTGEVQQQQQPNPTVSNAPHAEETSSNNPPSTSTTSPGKLETSKPIAETTLPGRSSKKSAKVATTKASNPSKAQQILPNGSKPPPTPPDPKLLDQITAAITEGDWHKKRGEYKEAISAYEKGLALDPSNPELKRKIQEARNAKEAADRSLGKNPSSQ